MVRPMCGALAAAVAIVASAPAGAAPEASAPVAALAARECAVVAQWIARLRGEMGRNNVAVSERTLPDVVSRRGTHSRWGGERPSLTAWKDYRRKTGHERSLRGCRGLEAQLARASWSLQRWADGGSAVVFSRVGFNADQTEAVLGYSYDPGGTGVPGHEGWNIPSAVVLRRSSGSAEWTKVGYFSSDPYLRGDRQ